MPVKLLHALERLEEESVESATGNWRPWMPGTIVPLPSAVEVVAATQASVPVTMTLNSSNIVNVLKEGVSVLGLIGKREKCSKGWARNGNARSRTLSAAQ